MPESLLVNASKAPRKKSALEIAEAMESVLCFGFSAKSHTIERILELNGFNVEAAINVRRDYYFNFWFILSFSTHEIFFAAFEHFLNLLRPVLFCFFSFFGLVGKGPRVIFGSGR